MKGILRNKVLSNQNGESSTVEEEAHVSFSHLQIYEYSLRICDNPGCQRGPAIAIDQVTSPKAHEQAKKIPITQYEELQARKGGRRRLNQLRLSRFEREETLKGLGFSRKEMDEWTARKDAIRKSIAKSAVRVTWKRHPIRAVVAALTDSHRPKPGKHSTSFRGDARADVFLSKSPHQVLGAGTSKSLLSLHKSSPPPTRQNSSPKGSTLVVSRQKDERRGTWAIGVASISNFATHKSYSVRTTSSRSRRSILSGLGNRARSALLTSASMH